MVVRVLVRAAAVVVFVRVRAEAVVTFVRVRAVVAVMTFVRVRAAAGRLLSRADCAHPARGSDSPVKIKAAGKEQLPDRHVRVLHLQDLRVALQ